MPTTSKDLTITFQRADGKDHKITIPDYKDGITDAEIKTGAQAIVDHAVADCLERHVSDWGKIKNVVKDALSEFLWKRTKRSPMILPIIMEA